MMKYERFKVSEHAAQRMAQRNLDLGDLALVLRYGRVEHRTGVEFHFLGRRDLPAGMERRLERLVGTTLIVASGEIVTVYRNRRALSEIRRKSKRYRPELSSPHSSRALPPPERFYELGSGLPAFDWRPAKGGERLWH